MKSRIPARSRCRAARREIRGSGAAGFSLIELLITLLVVAEILVVAGLMFDLHNKTARAQNQVADMQQSLRVAQREMVEVVRMAGRGGLVANLPLSAPTAPVRVVDGLAIQVENNVAAGTQIVADDAETAVVPGTDVLRVRGVFDAPLYQLVSSALDTGPNLVYSPTSDNPTTAETGTVVINDPSPTGFPQDLQPLIDAEAGSGLILVSPLSDAVYGVVELIGAVPDDPDDPRQVTVSFRATGSDLNTAYRALFSASGNLPDNLTGAAFVGLLEEHVFYVREARAIPGDGNSEVMPRLTRTRVFPRTGVGVGDDFADHSFDLADNVLDLQIALGYNSDADGEFYSADVIDDLVLVETADGAADDWLFNGAGDDPDASPWAPPWTEPDGGGTPQPQLQYVRLTTLVRTEGREFQYISPPIERIEDRVYGEPAVPAGRDPDREFHRRLLRTVVDLRNL